MPMQMPAQTDAGLFQQFLAQELRRCACDARDVYVDPVLLRYRILSRAQRSAQLNRAEAQEYAQLLSRIYSRWRWRQATTQALAHRRQMP